MLTIGVTAVGVDELARGVRFWCEALDYLVVHSTERSAALDPRSGGGVPLYLHVSDSPAQEHPGVHLDLIAPDRASRTAEVARLELLGALVVDWDSYPSDPDFVVMADTEGNRFCVVDASHESDAEGPSGPRD